MPNHIWGWISRLVAYTAAGYTWWQSWIGTRAMWEARELDQTLQIGFVLETKQRALAQAVPKICNSDQGSHFTSPQYTQLLLSHDVRIAMDGKGRALDNIFTERVRQCACTPLVGVAQHH